MKKKAPIIESHSLTIGYRKNRKKLHVVHEALDLQLNTGCLTSLLGLNGAGKSTLLRTLSGFQPPLKGTVLLKNKPLKAYSPVQIASLIGVVLTEKTNAGGITVFDLVSLGRNPYTGFWGQLSRNDIQITEQAIEAVGITHKANKYISELSDGERQKAMIAKVLAQQCPIIILDEPTAFLDVSSRIEVMSLLHRLAVEQNKAILLSTHDFDLAIQMSDNLWLLEKGRPLERGTPEDLILDGQFESFFNKEGLIFDRSTGKLQPVLNLKPIGIDGDFNTAYWVGNALVRNGYQPSPKSDSYAHIHCLNKNHMIITWLKGKTTIADSVASVIAQVQNQENNE